jgi:hypothetical protein
MSNGENRVQDLSLLAMLFTYIQNLSDLASEVNILGNLPIVDNKPGPKKTRLNLVYTGTLDSTRGYGCVR